MFILPSTNGSFYAEILWQPLRSLIESKVSMVALGVIAVAGLSSYCLLRKPSPTGNLLRSVGNIIRHANNPIAAMPAILNLPKDDHGNILIGFLDDNNFTLWKNLFQYIVPTKFFGPTLIPTDPKVIQAILSHPKNGTPETPFIGNRSTDTIHQLYTDQNGFAGVNSEAHKVHREHFKNWIANEDINIDKIAPVINEWIHGHNGIIITEKEIEHLTAQCMLTFLLDPLAAHDESLVRSIIQIKMHFINFGLNPLSSGVEYQQALIVMKQAIDKLLKSSRSYPHFLNEDFNLEQIHNHIFALMSVGFDNLQSSLMSLFVRMASLNDQDRQLLKAEVNTNDYPFIQFSKHEQNPKRIFFLEMLRLNPAVWLQSRKCKNEEVKISYTTEAGEIKTFRLPPSTLILIPNFALNRRIDNPEALNIHRALEAFKNIHSFSMGPNTCPGQKIPYATLGVLAATFLKRDIKFSIVGDEPKYNPGVALLMKNIRIRITLT